MDDEAVSYFGADDKLRIYNRHVGLGTTSDPGGVYEEYRYDALGRRVMTRSRSTASCQTPACNSYIERVAWDGAQLLMEVRGGGRDGLPADSLNSDSYIGRGADHWPFGRVRYTHAGGIDAPLTIIRGHMEGQPTLAVAPHANWQGDFEVGSFMDGTMTTSCSGGSGCPLISWPGHQTTVDGESTLDGAAFSWFGSLVGNRTDGSGLQYMRNRYYDPKTGRFTQEDPIGLAGGMNLYGFAGGDPMSYSDPFGLSPCYDSDGKKVSEEECQDLLEKGSDKMDEGFERLGEALTSECSMARAELGARFATDVGLGLLYASGVGSLARGALFVAEGQAISSGLILTTTLRSAGSTGAGETLLGGAYMATGASSIAARAAAVPTPLSAIPGGNTYNFVTNDGLAACRR